MSLGDCLGRAVRQTGMDPARARRVLAHYNQTLTGLRGQLAPSAAQVQAAQIVVAAAVKDAAERRRVVGLTAAAAARGRDRLLASTYGPSQGLVDFVANPNGAGDSTISGRYEAVRRTFRRDLARFIAKHRANLLGMRRKRGDLNKVVDEIFGRNTGDAEARAFARAWADAAEEARLRFNAAGGRIPKRADWGMPQNHDARAINKASYEVWRDFMRDRLDFTRMVDESTGLPFTRASIEPRMREAFDKITTDGLSHRQPTAGMIGQAAYNRRLDPRFFVFKSPEAWREYQARFGSGDAYRVMLGHLDHMARDIAEMEMLGPSPTTMFGYLRQVAEQAEARIDGPKGVERARSKGMVAQNMFDLHRGITNQPGTRWLAQTMSAIRQYLASAHLGAAFITSFTDFNSQRVAAGFVGMQRTGFLRRMGRLMTSFESRIEAAEAGLIFENAVDLGHAAGRFQLEDLHLESAARLSSFTIRASGLGYLTEVHRQAFGMEFMRHAARQMGKSWDQLDAPLRRAFERYGILERDWQVLRQVATHDANGLQILRAREIAGASQDLADRYLEMIVSLTEFAVPTQNLRGRAAILGTTRPGTVSGEFMRSFMQFKAFPVTVMVTQARRLADEAHAGRRMTALTYAANFFVGMTIMGAISLQLKETAKGRDPRNMTTPQFWAAAALQGGGLGLFGDFFFADLNRFGMSPWEQLGGPTGSFLADVGRLTLGNAQALIAGKDTNAANDMIHMLRRYTPGGSLWYARLAFEREVLDQLQLAIDPKARRRFRARERAARDFDTQFFWRPGQSVIRGDRVRAPDFENALDR